MVITFASLEGRLWFSTVDRCRVAWRDYGLLFHLVVMCTVRGGFGSQVQSLVHSDCLWGSVRNSSDPGVFKMATAQEINKSLNHHEFHFLLVFGRGMEDTVQESCRHTCYHPFLRDYLRFCGSIWLSNDAKWHLVAPLKTLKAKKCEMLSMPESLIRWYDCTEYLIRWRISQNVRSMGNVIWFVPYPFAVKWLKQLILQDSINSRHIPPRAVQDRIPAFRMTANKVSASSVRSISAGLSNGLVLSRTLFSHLLRIFVWARMVR